MPDRHKVNPIPFRPPEGDRARLLAHAERTEKPVNRILADALAAYLDLAGEPKSTATPEQRQVRGGNDG